jgi:branched-chain amino acid aminotransferase
MARERMVWINGEMVPASEARVSIFDRGFQYGDAAFDAMRTYNHKPFRREDYLDRFFASLKSLAIDPGVSRAELNSIIDKVLAANLPLISENEEYQVILRCTRGADAKRDVLDPGPPTLIVDTPTFKIDAAAYYTGVDVLVSSVRRFPAEVASPKAKTHFRLNNVLADLEVKQRDPSARSLMLDMAGNVAEGSSYNIAAMVHGVLITPKNNCLEGVAMKTVIEIANKIGINARYDDLTVFDLYNSPEAFITGTSNGMLPVRSVDGRTVGIKIPGQVQERIWVEYNKIAGLDVREQAAKYLNAEAAAQNGQRAPIDARLAAKA